MLKLSVTEVITILPKCVYHRQHFAGMERVSKSEDAGLPEERICQNEPVESASQPVTQECEDTTASMFKALKEPLPSKLTAKDITDYAQQLIDSLNLKRKQDTKLLQDYKQALDDHVTQAVERLQQSLFQTYEAQQILVEDKLQTLFASLDRISVAEAELGDFKQSLQLLYQDMHHTE